MVEYTAGTAVFNDWIITREIGQGATGHVYEIKKNGYGEEIRSALKVIRIPKSPSDVMKIVMPEEDVQIVAEYVDKEYKLTVENGSGSGEYKAGEKVEVSADKHAEAFYKWEIADDIEHSDATNETVEIVMPEKDIQLVATYYTDTNCEDDYNTGENTTE